MHHSLKNIILVVVVVIAILALFGVVRSLNESEISQESLGSLPGGSDVRIIFGNTTLRAGVADEREERIQGLSGRESLGEREGLLFIFPESGFHGIWMKDMFFSIDIVWLDENFRVVGLEEEVSPDTFPTSFEPEAPAKYVLEVNAGLSSKAGVFIGEEIFIEGL